MGDGDIDVGIFAFNLREKKKKKIFLPYTVCVVSGLLMDSSRLAGLSLKAEEECTGNLWGCGTLVL